MRTYEELTAPYRRRNAVRMAAVLALLASGFAIIMNVGPKLGGEQMTPPVLALLAVGVAAEYAGMISTILTVIHSWILRTARRDTLGRLHTSGEYDTALAQLLQAETVQVNGLPVAFTREHLYLPHGAVYKMADILWISPAHDVVRFLIIPLVHMSWHTLHMADGTQAVAFYGRVRREQEAQALEQGLRGVHEKLLFGSAADNEWKYYSRLRAPKKEG